MFSAMHPGAQLAKQMNLSFVNYQNGVMSSMLKLQLLTSRMNLVKISLRVNLDINKILKKNVFGVIGLGLFDLIS